MNTTPGAARPNASTPLDRAQLTRRRILAGLQQKELAEMAGISKAQISRLELGRTGTSPDVLRRLAEALGCEPADLMPDEVAAS